nr:unnamed protein product [Meloidogyne enterolobii]
MSTMSITNLGVNLLSTLTLFNWKSIALISCPDCGESRTWYKYGIVSYGP